MIDLGKVKGLGTWPETRVGIERAVRDVLGELPKQRGELQIKTVDEHSFPGFTRRRVNYFVGDWERVSAWVFLPDGRDDVPGILCCHQSVPQGKDETAGLSGHPKMAFAQHFAELGYATIAPDCVTAGERRPAKGSAFDTKGFYKENPNASVVGKMLVDHQHALDVLCDISRVDSARIGVIGHSLGGVNAMMMAAFDDRVQVCVSSCAFTRFTDDDDPERWVREEGFTHFPKLREAVKAREFPFDWEHLLALIAPNPTLVISATNDEVLSNTKSVDKAVKSARSIYKMLGEQSALDHYVHSRGHGMTVEILEQCDDWFDRWL
ncbi:MAG: hypothetical protein AMXMBFR84_37150 [Candidatus Hydrogenedentota bacterium]